MKTRTARLHAADVDRIKQLSRLGESAPFATRLNRVLGGAREATRLEDRLRESICQALDRPA